MNILSEWIAEDVRLRERIREQFQKFGIVSSKVKKGKEQQAQKFRDYFSFSERLNRIPSHRILALFRAEKEGLLNLKIEVDKEKAIQNIERSVYRKYSQNGYMHKAIEESYKRILQPNFESESKRELKEKADLESISVFAKNLKQLLLQSPLGGKNMLAIDPGFRTGCKVAVLNNHGDFLENTTIYPHEPQRQTAASGQSIRTLVEKFAVEAIAVGNGTAGRETEAFVKSLGLSKSVQVVLVNESGASIYSASEVARNEFPDLDLTVRGAVSIGRRLMDPLAELVKIDPKSIGVGQYQHDVDQQALKNSLDDTVISAVNKVGVEVNTASKELLTYVSGLGPQLAQNIVDYRKENGVFKSRKELKEVARMGQKAFEQSAGFLRPKAQDLSSTLACQFPAPVSPRCQSYARWLHAPRSKAGCRW